MKNKKFIYLLITALAGVWGVIFYQVFTVTHDEEAITTITMTSKDISEPLDYYKLKDTFVLALNYRDPMLEDMLSETEPLVIVPEASLQQPVSFIAPKPVVVNTDIIKYTGYILNASGKLIVAIINLNGKELMLSEGEKVRELKIIKNYKDSVKINYKDQIKYIRLE